MYISIDKHRMAVVHKHSDHRVVSRLASIELAHVACTVAQVDPDCLAMFTDLELKALHKSITGADFVGYSHPHLVAACVELVRRMPDTDVNGFEVDLQYRAIADDDSDRYRYVKGSTKPAPVDELFEPAVQQVPRLTAEELLALPLRKGAQRSTAGATGPASTPAAASGAPAPRSRPVAPATATPRGGQRTVIWDAADAAWESAGKPTNLQVILKLRKQIMDDLEKQGVKRTSCSSELGNWQKARCGA